MTLHAEKLQRVKSEAKGGAPHLQKILCACVSFCEMVHETAYGDVGLIDVC